MPAHHWPRRHDTASPASKRLAALAVAAALVTAAAVSAQVVRPTAAHADGVSSPVTTTAAAIADARDQAVATGAPVAIGALTTPTETVTANPTGTLSITQSVYPTRVRSGDGWTPVDTSLHAAADGSVVPAAVPSGIAFSGGGSGHLVTMTSRGRTLSVDWPGTLPTPSLSGSSAVYSGVFPGVDLTVTATPLGGFTEVLTVKNAAAAADPGLASLHLSTHTVGLSVSSDAGGNLAATDPSGQPYFSSPAADMWDSSTNVGNTGASTSTTRSALAAPAASAPDDPVASSDQGPGTGAQTAQIPATVSSGVITLSPDATVLRGAATHYPVYIDPGWNPNWAADPKQSYDEVQQGCPTKNALNSSTAPYNTPGVGLNDYSGCIGKERAYYQFKVDTRLWNSTATPVEIVSATLKATEASSASCSVTSNVNAYIAGEISTSTNWNNQPGPDTFQDAQPFGPACTSNPSQGFDISNAAGDASKNHWPAMAFVLEAADESNDLDFRRFTNNPTVTVEYNTTPKVTAVSTSPPSTCSGGTTIGNTTISLHATVSDPDKGFPVYAKFTLTNSAGATVKPAVQIGPVSTSGTLTWNIGTLTTGTYTWTAAAYDLRATSKATTCKFSVDTTAPGRPTITSTAYPLTDNGVPDQRISGGGQFDFTPASGVTDTASYAYNWGSQPPSVNPPHTVTADANGHAAVTLTPTGLHNTLWVVAVDKAGNQSQPNDYVFNLVPPTTEPPAGDVTGDGKPDLLVPGSNGALRLYPGSGSGKLAPPVEYAAPSSFSNALVGMGDINQDFTQDVLTRQSDGNANLYSGNGDAEADSLDPTQADLVQTPMGMPFAWSDITHLVVASAVIGGIPGDVDGDGNGPDMFATTTDGNLWLLSAGAAPPSIGSVMPLNSGWGNQTIADAGSVGGYPALWARNDTTGELDLYSGAANVIAGSPNSAATKTTSTTVLTAASFPQLFTAGDTNNDGLPDLWATDTNAAHSVWFLPSTGSAGTLAAKTYVQTLVPHNDFNGDGRSDMAAWYNYADTTSGLVTFPGLPDGTIAGPTKSYTSGPGSWDSSKMQFTSGDYNGDGKSDMAAVYDYGQGHIEIYVALANTTGGFNAPTVAYNSAPGSWYLPSMTLHSGDFNGDGRDDLAVWYSYTTGEDTLFTFTANTQGQFNAPFTSWSNSNNDWDVNQMKFTTGDFNADGHDDLAALYGYTDGHVTMFSFLTTPTGAFQSSMPSWTSTGWGDWNRTYLQAGDYNGDGKDDVAAWYDYADGHDALHTFLSYANGTGGFNTPTQSWNSAAGNFDYSHMKMTAGDYNGDGRDDLAALYGYTDGTNTTRTFSWLGTPTGGFAGSYPGWSSTAWAWDNFHFLNRYN